MKVWKRPSITIEQMKGQRIDSTSMWQYLWQSLKGKDKQEPNPHARDIYGTWMRENEWNVISAEIHAWLYEKTTIIRELRFRFLVSIMHESLPTSYVSLPLLLKNFSFISNALNAGRVDSPWSTLRKRATASSLDCKQWFFFRASRPPISQSRRVENQWAQNGIEPSPCSWWWASIPLC